MALPKQIHRSNMQHEAAYAPYNFVPLPNSIVSAQGLPDHDRFYPDRHSGYFTVILKTLSPTYVRCGLLNKPKASEDTDYARSQKEKIGKNDGIPFRELMKNKAEFFHVAANDQPVIPGSSLRGMIRNLVEIGSFSTLSQFSDSKFFYRAPDRSDYSERMVKRIRDQRIPGRFIATLFESKVKAGILKKDNGKWFVEERWIARVEMSDIADLFGKNDPVELYEVNGQPSTAGADSNPNQVPQTQFQHKEIWCDVGPYELQAFPAQLRNNGQGYRHRDLYLKFRRATNLSLSTQPGKTQGLLVLTGHMENKHLAHIFLKPNGQGAAYPVDAQKVEQFNSKEQLTKWQTDAFTHDGIKENDPVFFIVDDDGKSVRFFGRAQLFRLPYHHTVRDLVPESLRKSSAEDFAVSMFGHVSGDTEIGKKHKQGAKERAYSGRVFVSDAVLSPKQQSPIWLVPPQNEALVPNILGSPKPTAFAHYLVQSSDDSRDLFHYDSNSSTEGELQTTIRGHKRYWPKGNLTLAQLKARPTSEETNALFERDAAGSWRVKANSSQHTQMRPVNASVSFEFKVRFENLTDEELGALAWALDLSKDDKYAHSIGMGKPFGMGAVKLSATLTLIKRDMRYERLIAEMEGHAKTLQAGEVTAETSDYIGRFKTYLFKNVSRDDKLDSDNALANDFDNLPRIRRLMKLAEWQESMGRTALSRREYMPLEKFKRRPVLPDPLDVDDGGPGEHPRPHQQNLRQTPPATTNQSPQQQPQIHRAQHRPERSAPTNTANQADAPQPAQPTPTAPKTSPVEEKVTAALAQRKQRGSTKGQLKIKHGERDVQLPFDGFASFDDKPAGTRCKVGITRNSEGKPNKVLRFIDWE